MNAQEEVEARGPHRSHAERALVLDYEETLVLRNVLHRHNVDIAHSDWKMEALEKRLDAHLDVAEIRPPSWSGRKSY